MNKSRWQVQEDWLSAIEDDDDLLPSIRIPNLGRYDIRRTFGSVDRPSRDVRLGDGRERQ